MTASTPEWAELLQQAVEARLFDVHTAMPGQVVAVHTDGSSQRQYIDVRPCLRRSLDADASSAVPFVEEDLPVLPRVPVGYPQGGGWFVAWPLAVGDFVTLVFAERSLDRWIATARKSRQQAISTGDVGTHTLDGAIALPCGPAPQAELLEGLSGSDMVLGHVSGTPRLTLAADGTIAIDGSLVVTGTVTASAVAARPIVAGVPGPMLVDLYTHIHGPPGTPPTPTPPASPP